MEFCSNWLRLITLCKNVTLFWCCGTDWICDNASGVDIGDEVDIPCICKQQRNTEKFCVNAL